MKVRVDPYGETNALPLTINTVVWNPDAGSINGGSIVLTGKGLPEEWPSYLWSIQLVSNGKAQPVDVISTSPTRLELRVNSGTDGQTY